MLEKILEEIDNLKKLYSESSLNLIDKGNFPCEYDKSDVESAKVQALSEAIAIIRKHMNDGWIPVEERLPEKNAVNPITFCGGKAIIHVGEGVCVMCKVCGNRTISLVDGVNNSGAVYRVAEKWNNRVGEENEND